MKSKTQNFPSLPGTFLIQKYIPKISSYSNINFITKYKKNNIDTNTNLDAVKVKPSYYVQLRK